jgi:aminopeptidase-like protein
VGCLSRSRESEFEQYHSSADGLDLVRPEQLEGALAAALAILDVVETDGRYVNLAPKGEPQLGKRGLYRSTGGGDPDDEQLALLWVLNLSDGDHSLLEIAERAGLSFSPVRDAADRLLEAGLLAPDSEVSP